MNDRLLSDNQLSDAHIQGGGSLTGLRNVAATQLTKTDKEWVEWLLKAWQYCGLGCSKHISLKFSITSGTIVTECFFLEDSCRVWQDRKKEIGYEL